MQPDESQPIMLYCFFSNINRFAGVEGIGMRSKWGVDRQFHEDSADNLRHVLLSVFQGDEVGGHKTDP